VIVKTVTGLITWPMHWAETVEDDTSKALLRLMCIVHAPLAVVSASSSFTGGWALPAGFLWFLIVMGVFLLHGDNC